MCNYLHKGSVPIPATGKGWKIFSSGNALNPCYAVVQLDAAQSYSSDPRSGVRWNDSESNIGDGFCFFLTRKEARKALNAMDKVIKRVQKRVLRRIEYTEGLGSHIETNMIREHAFRIALCKQFKVINGR